MSTGTATQLKDELIQKFQSKNATIGILGLGYVGLPLAVCKAKVGFNIIGFDLASGRVDDINNGKNYISDVDDTELKELVEKGKIKATTDFSKIEDIDAVIICVPTPLTKNRDPDISYIKSATLAVSKYLKKGLLISLESTTYPGTTEEIMLPILESTGLKVGEDFFLSYSPERVDPGNQRYTTHNTNKVLGGVTPACREVATALYKQSILNIVQVSSPGVAEMTKVFENTFRSVNIALVNELALLCDKMKINVWEVLDAAATKPFGIMSFYPGPGVGGHCIPIDPFYLTWKAREYNFHTRFIELAGEINNYMPLFVREKVYRALNTIKVSINGAKILVAGIAYKKDTEDYRESPALELIHLLKKDGADIYYNDPYVSEAEIDGKIYKSTSLDNLSQFDCVIIASAHSNYDYTSLVKNAKIVVDTRNGTKAVTENREKIILL